MLQGSRRLVTKKSPRLAYDLTHHSGGTPLMPGGELWGSGLFVGHIYPG